MRDLLETLVNEVPVRFPAIMAYMQRCAECEHCAAGNTPYKLKRQTVHHFANTGRTVVCEAATLKPGS